MRRCLLLAALGTLATASSSAADVRDPFLQPFGSRSLWNTSLGSGARWSRAEDPDTRQLRHPDPWINAGAWSMPYFLGKASDQRLRFTDSDKIDTLAPQRLHAPAGIHPALPAGGDRHIILFDPSKRRMFHYYGCDRSPDGFACTLAHEDDACGDDGLNGYGWGTGVIRRWELGAGRIDHMLRYSLPVTLTLSATKSPGGIDAWPATGEDYLGPQMYSGQVLFGSTIGLPADVDIGALGLSAPGLALAHALQDYGALQRDTGGEHGMTLYAEESAEGMPELDAMRRDLPKIVPHLAVLRNQAPPSPNGGGTRRRPPVPPLDPAICGKAEGGR